MFDVLLRNASHTREYSIRAHGVSGWEVKLEADRHVTRHVWYHDWHRVERALDAFVREVSELMEQGWIEVRSTKVEVGS